MQPDSRRLQADLAAARDEVRQLRATIAELRDELERISIQREDEVHAAVAVAHEEIEQLKREGVIACGIIPKVDCALDAVQGGTKKAHIIDGRLPHALLLEIFTEHGVGTAIWKK